MAKNNFQYGGRPPSCILCVCYTYDVHLCDSVCGGPDNNFIYAFEIQYNRKHGGDACTDDLQFSSFQTCF